MPLPPEVLMLIAEIGEATDEIIARHEKKGREAGNALEHWLPLQVKLYSHDDLLAQYWEDGVEVEPREDK